MQEYIQENHIEEIEDMIHKLASSKSFVEQFIKEEERHLLDDISLNKRDVRIGDDVDVYVNHITEHQTFTMIMVPISIYNMAIYDTLLFSVIEVSDEWVRREFPYDDIEDDSTKSHLLTLKNHELLAHHLYSQALKISHTSMGQVHVDLNESYISSGSIHEHTSNLSKHEKDEMRRHWGVLKKAFTHVIDLNVEFNIYVFGFNDLEVSVKNRKGDYSITITPKNVFQRHHFLED
ncbi:hypothetical protein [Reichenbachiella ulvae]|uniref:Uncharacterized protein n=1 Tax=Reichenbachiella ulvae TaxID=2980104 RepID=A0ABT3CQC9_9BACT|nr:hypothetical protein [Reichenbachiella ulvae]MCV9385822.1 hypothetical protein [Reichenbachiella ulvae]